MPWIRRPITKTGFPKLTRTAMRIIEQGFIIEITSLIHNYERGWKSQSPTGGDGRSEEITNQSS